MNRRILLYQDYCDQSYLLYQFHCDLLRTHVLYTGLYKYTQPLIVLPEPLPETGVLANHSSNFNLVRRTAGRPDTQTCLWRSHHNLKILLVLVIGHFFSERNWESFTELVYIIKQETMTSGDKTYFFWTGSNVLWQEIIS